MVLLPRLGYGKTWIFRMPLRSLLALAVEMATACTSQREAHRAQVKQGTISLA